jgi:hypothetical protein
MTQHRHKYYSRMVNDADPIASALVDERRRLAASNYAFGIALREALHNGTETAAGVLGRMPSVQRWKVRNAIDYRVPAPVEPKRPVSAREPWL